MRALLGQLTKLEYELSFTLSTLLMLNLLDTVTILWLHKNNILIFGKYTLKKRSMEYGICSKRIQKKWQCVYVSVTVM